MSERDAVMFANEAFYRAFTDRDIELMDQVWARDFPVACIHPGWPVLEGRQSVMDSWAGILQSANSPRIECREAEAYLRGEMAFVICYEEIGGQYLIATNIFVRENGPWRLVHHQAGPTSGEPSGETVSDEERIVN